MHDALKQQILTLTRLIINQNYFKHNEEQYILYKLKD
jgi:hypothetical protein